MKIKRKIEEKGSGEIITCIGPSILIKGELSGSEDLYIDGTVEGKILLEDHTLIIEPEGKVMAEIHGNRIIINGKVSGNIHAKELVIVNETGSIKGDIFSARVSIAEGAHFEGRIETEKPADLVSPFKYKKKEKEEAKKKTEEGEETVEK